MRNKPSGELTSLEISNGTPKLHKSRLTGSKEDIETYIAAGFCESVEQKGWLYWKKDSLEKCKENDFDFKVNAGGASIYIELMEFAPLDFYRTRYESAPATYDIYDMATYLFSKIESKSFKYPEDIRIILLIYATDWKFQVSVQMHTLMQFFCATKGHVFESIFFYRPNANGPDSTEALYPVMRKDWSDFDSDAYKGLKAIAVPLDSVMIHNE